MTGNTQNQLDAIVSDVEKLKKQQLEQGQDQVTMKKKINENGKRIGQVEVKQQHEENSRKARSIIMISFEG